MFPGIRPWPCSQVCLRGAVSIARRLLDPLAELVKIDPRSIGVGLYQHDVDQKRLAEATVNDGDGMKMGFLRCEMEMEILRFLFGCLSEL